MDCPHAQDRLVELVYGELAAADAAAVRAHLDGCPACRAEHAQLLAGRRLMQAFRAGEPATTAAGPTSSAGAAATLRPRWRWASLAAAGVVLAAGGALWLAGGGGEGPRALAGPVEIRRESVSLTILSRPDGYAAPPTQDGQQVGPGQSLYRYRQPVWQGLALVRDQRIVRNLPRGASEVRFADVPAAIRPDTVRLRGLADAPGLTILEQNYQFDLASSSAVLQRYVGRDVTVVLDDGSTVRGALLSFSRPAVTPVDLGYGTVQYAYDGPRGQRPYAEPAGKLQLVVQPAGGGPRTISAEAIAAVRFADLPAGLHTRPTLVWQLDNAAAAQQQFEVAYLTGGLSWRADYVLRLTPGAPAGGGEAPPILDAADLVGYATVTNTSGVTFEDAQLELMAGDVNLVATEEEKANRLHDALAKKRQEEDKADGGFEEQSFFEYHLYTLGRPTTLRDRETKQIEMVSAGGLKFTRGYLFDPDAHASAPRVVSEMANLKENGLGRPLPKGLVRLYAPDPEGVAAYVAQAEIDHTPVGQKLRLEWGWAFDLGCKAAQVGGGRRGDIVSADWAYTIFNAKDYPVTVTVRVRVPRTTTQATCDLPWRVREVGVVEIDVPVPAGQRVVAKFSYSYGLKEGGGLKAPGPPDPKLPKAPPAAPPMNGPAPAEGGRD